MLVSSGRLPVSPSADVSSSSSLEHEPMTISVTKAKAGSVRFVVSIRILGNISVKSGAECIASVVRANHLFAN